MKVDVCVRGGEGRVEKGDQIGDGWNKKKYFECLGLEGERRVRDRMNQSNMV